MGTDLSIDFAGVAGAGGVATRQAQHLASVGHYVTDVCDRTEAFGGVITPLAGPYADALASAQEGVRQAGVAGSRWGEAAQETAADLADADALARRLLARLAELFPDWLGELGDAPVAGGSTLAAGAATPAAPCPDQPLPTKSPVPLSSLTGLKPDLPDGLGASFGAAGAAVGQGLTLGKDMSDMANALDGLADDRDAISRTDADLDAYDAFQAGGSGTGPVSDR